MDELRRKGIEKLYKKVMRDRGLPEKARETLQAMWASHSRKGNEYRMQGKLRKAIEEYRKDTELDVTGEAEATVVENAFCQMGDTFMELGEIENAIAAYEKALELWREYGYGFAPHAGLAKAYLGQGRVDDAISICEECLETSRSWGVRQILAEARRRKLEQ